MKRKADRLLGQMNGSIDRHRPERSIVVPSEQLQPPPLPFLPPSKKRITAAQITEMLDWELYRVRHYISMGRFEPVAYNSKRRRSPLFDPAQVRAAVKRWPRPQPASGDKPEP